MLSVWALKKKPDRKDHMFLESYREGMEILMLNYFQVTNISKSGIIRNMITRIRFSFICHNFQQFCDERKM